MPKKSVKKATGNVATKKAVKKSVVKKAVKKAVTKRAGRPKGTGKYGCETIAVRIPVHLEGEVQAFVTKKIRAEGKKP